jgi:hypothetical protein
VVKNFLDSGDNEFMFKDMMAKTTEKVRTRIETAGKGGSLDVNQASLVFNDKKTPVIFGVRDRALFSDALADNLSSVGRLCETGFKIVFETGGYRIVRGDVNVLGEVVHKEGRDMVTGLYPLTLLTPSEEQASRFLFRNLKELRAKYTRLVRWAEVENKKSRLAHYGCAVKLNKLPSRGNVASLAKFYIKQDVSPLERWHRKLGHVGSKVLRKCGIPNLAIPRTPLRCESCIKGKIHRLGHLKNAAGLRKQVLPGECRHTDHQGPYVVSMGGAKYSQIFLDLRPRKYGLSKTGSYEALKKVLLDARVRSGRRPTVTVFLVGRLNFRKF